MPAGERPARSMQAQCECRTIQYGSPPCRSSRTALDVGDIQAMAMVVEVSGLDRVHRAQHGNAERNHREIGKPPTQSKGMVISVVDLPQACQKEEERAQECRGREAFVDGLGVVPGHQRSGKPWNSDEGLADNLAAAQRQQVPPFHGTKSPVEGLAHVMFVGCRQMPL